MPLKWQIILKIHVNITFEWYRIFLFEDLWIGIDKQNHKVIAKNFKPAALGTCVI